MGGVGGDEEVRLAFYCARVNVNIVRVPPQAIMFLRLAGMGKCEVDRIAPSSGALRKIVIGFSKLI